MAAAGYPVVLDGLVGPWMLDEVRSQTDPLGVRFHYVVLRPSRATALARATDRAADVPRAAGHPPLTDPQPILAMWDLFRDLGPYEDRVIDTTDLDAPATARAVWRMVAG